MYFIPNVFKTSTSTTFEFNIRKLLFKYVLWSILFNYATIPTSLKEGIQYSISHWAQLYHSFLLNYHNQNYYLNIHIVDILFFVHLRIYFIISTICYVRNNYIRPISFFSICPIMVYNCTVCNTTPSYAYSHSIIHKLMLFYGFDELRINLHCIYTGSHT